MSPVKCLECGLIWPSKNKAGGHGPHRLAFACMICPETFEKCKTLHSHEAAARHKPPKDLEPIMAAARAAAASRAACNSSTAGPSHAPAPEDEDDTDSEVGEGEGGYSCTVCYMEFMTHDDLADHVSGMLHCTVCMSCFSPFQSLEDHYWDSDDHPKCRPCILGFENLDAFTAHKVVCPVTPVKRDKPAGRPRGRPPGARPPARRPPATATTFEPTSGSITTVSSVTTSSGGSSWSTPRRPRAQPTSSAAPQPAGTAPTPPEAPQPPFFCKKCKVQCLSEEELQEHFASSSAHPKCRTCGMGFDALGTWAAHKAGCPPVASSTEAPAVINSVPAVTAASTPAGNLAPEPVAEVDLDATPSSATLLAARVMSPSEDSRSTTASEHPSPSYTEVEQEPTVEDPPYVTVYGEASNLIAFDSNGEGEGSHKMIQIDGRDEQEEMHWYDPAVRAKHARPGPGILPSLLADMLHAPNHALYSVATENRPAPASLAPTMGEVRTAIPHWTAYFCPEHNGWVLLQWSASAALPPLAREPQTPLPNQSRRMHPSACVGSGGQQAGHANLTHHWHRYEKVVDAATLSPPYAHGELLLDLYLCCQCMMSCLVSDVIPGVIPASLVEEFTRDKVGHPVGGKTPEATVVAAWETVLTIIDNRLWKDEKRSLPVSRPKFREKIGWNGSVERVFEALGFRLDGFLQGAGSTQEPMLQPPSIDPSTAEGRASRTTLLRAWVELSARLAIYREANKDALKDYTTMALHVTAESERDLCEVGIGAHIAQRVFPERIVSETELEASWRALGMTPSPHSWDQLAFAYLAQCRCDPANTTVYFTHLIAIMDGIADAGECVPDELRSFIETEKKERGRFTMEEHARQARILGFGRDCNLGVELDSDVEDDFIAQAWRRARQRTWLTAADQTAKRAQLDDALRAVAQQRGSVALVNIWNEERGSGMLPETAYQMLDVPREADEKMLLTAYKMRIEDRPGQSERMREALSIVAETMSSERLREFLATGSDPDDTTIEAANEDLDSPVDGDIGQYLTPSVSRSASPATSTAMEGSGQLLGKQLPVGDDYHPAAPTTSSAKVLSFHCRSCRRDPCVDPVATACGHLFCHSCIVDSLAARGCCPVCQRSFLIRLHVEVDVDGS